jgi:hypothetical protein
LEAGEEPMRGFQTAAVHLERILKVYRYEVCGK